MAADAPINDAFANRIVVNGTNAILSGTTAYATREADEPPVPGSTIGHTVWWTWTAPANGELRLSIPQENYSTAVAIFTGNEPGQLQLVSSNLSQWAVNFGIEDRMRDGLRMDVRAGRAYQIAVDWNQYAPGSGLIPPSPLVIVGTNENGEPVWGEAPEPALPPETGGTIGITLAFTQAPTNDEFGTPAEMLGKKWAVVGASTVGASDDDGEPTNSNHSVWWSWTAPKSGLAAVSFNAISEKAAPVTATQLASWPEPTYDDPEGWPADREMWLRTPATGGTYVGDTDVFVYINGELVIDLGGVHGDPGTTLVGNPVELNPISPFIPILSVYQGDSLATLAPLGSTTDETEIQFRAIKGQTYRVSLGSTTTTAGETNFNFLLTAPENDEFADRMAISGVEATATGHTVGATRDAGEPASLVGEHSAWWTYTPAVNGNLTLRFSGTNTALTVFRGADLESLVPAGTTTGEITLSAPAGQPLQFAVDGVGTDGEGDYSLTLTLDPLPPAIDAAQSKRLPDGSFLLRAEQLRGRKITVSVSSDLVTWEELWTGVVNGDGIGIRDFGAIGLDSVFYRVRLAP